MLDSKKTKPELLKEIESLKKQIQKDKNIEAELQFIIDSVPAYLYYQDVNGIFKYVNKAVETATGIPREEQVGKTVYEIHEDKRSWAMERYKFDIGVIKSGIPSVKIEKRELPWQKKSIWLEIISIPHIDKDGNTVGLIGMTYDVTKLKKANERINELYKKELKLKKELQLQMQNRLYFTRALVHELRTSLTPLLASSDFLTSNIQDEMLLKFAKNINDGALNLNKRVDELLDLSKGEVGILKLSYSRINTQQFIQNIIDFVSPQAKANSQRLVLDISPNLPALMADEQRLRQVLINLLDNAFKFTRKNGKITLSVNMENEGISFHVSDTGCGIDEAQKKHLFEPYKRLETWNSKSHGLGIGLTLCKMYVEFHGGYICLESTRGKGSTFWFWLPLKPEEKQ